ncbi:MAG: hypothetical protein WD651_02260 [Acidimicrobiia bacterium]
MRPQRVAIWVGLAGFAVGVAMTWAGIQQLGSVSGFLHIPAAEAAFYERLVGPVVVAPAPGHDGRYYLLLAIDPFLQQVDDYEAAFDFPRYRAQRIAYPMVAGLLGSIPAKAAMWSLVLVNIGAIGLGCWSTARLSHALGKNGWWGLSFVVNPGVYFELLIDGGSILGWALAILAIERLLKGRNGPAVLLLVAAGLSRETMLIVAAACAAYVFRNDPKWSIRLAAWPLAIWLAWATIVGLRLTGPMVPNTVSAAPFTGFGPAVAHWLDQGGPHLAVGVLVLMCTAIAIFGIIKYPSPVSGTALGFGLLMFVLGHGVLSDYGNLSRAMIPMVPSALLILAPVRS